LMMRTEIAKKMNDFVKAQVIQEITFYWYIESFLYYKRYSEVLK
jgi:hypothetical protein